MEKIILYCRVASGAQADKELDIQEKRLRECGERQGYKIVEVIKEIGSGANLNRSGINKIYEIIERQKIDAVIAANLSRYGRCSLINFIEKLASKGVKAVTAADGDLRDVIPVLKTMK